MTPAAQAEAERVEAETPYARRARYHTARNPFTFALPAVPMRQFLAERDRAFDPQTPTGLVPLDASRDLGLPYPATTPTLLTQYVKIRAGERLTYRFAASGEIYYVMSGRGESRNGADVIAWGEGDVFCFPAAARQCIAPVRQTACCSSRPTSRNSCFASPGRRRRSRSS